MVGGFWNPMNIMGGWGRQIAPMNPWITPQNPNIAPQNPAFLPPSPATGWMDNVPAPSTVTTQAPAAPQTNMGAFVNGANPQAAPAPQPQQPQSQPFPPAWGTRRNTNTPGVGMVGGGWNRVWAGNQPGQGANNWAQTLWNQRAQRQQQAAQGPRFGPSQPRFVGMKNQTDMLA